MRNVLGKHRLRFFVIFRRPRSTRQSPTMSGCRRSTAVVFTLAGILAGFICVTSALDSESEHLVQQAIDKAVVGRTVVIVAHRLSTIRQADQIVVMDNHKVVDAGHHEKLLGKCSKYRDLIKRQSVMVRDVSLAGMKNFGIIDEDEEDVDGFESNRRIDLGVELPYSCMCA